MFHSDTFFFPVTNNVQPGFVTKNHLCLLNLIYIEEYRIQHLYSSLFNVTIACSIYKNVLILRVIYMVKRMATEQVNEKNHRMFNTSIHLQNRPKWDALCPLKPTNVLHLLTRMFI